MADIDDLKTIRSNLIGELKNETGRRKALTDAGQPPPATYSANGRSVDWNGYIRAMREEIAELDKLIDQQEPYELITETFT